MPNVNYGTQEINWTFEERPDQRHHYITVEKVEGVILSGPAVDADTQARMVRAKAKWIHEKLELVRAAPPLEIVGGGRIPYLGRRYYIHLHRDALRRKPEVHFSGAQFDFLLPDRDFSQPELLGLLDVCLRHRLQEKLPPRIRRWTRLTGLAPQSIQIRSMDKRWASCTPENKLLFNTRCIQLPWRLLDYLIVHELAHTVVKDHSPRFWAEVARWMPDCAERDMELGKWRV